MLIEENVRYKGAFGFDKGDVLSVNSSGSKIIDICHSIAKQLFVDRPGSEWELSDIPKLGAVVKNRINAYIALFYGLSI